LESVLLHLTSSTTLTTQPGTRVAQYLVVAGGGGGGASQEVEEEQVVFEQVHHFSLWSNNISNYSRRRWSRITCNHLVVIKVLQELLQYFSTITSAGGGGGGQEDHVYLLPIGDPGGSGGGGGGVQSPGFQVEQEILRQ
jgi:hypothetical protein